MDPTEDAVRVAAAVAVRESAEDPVKVPSAVRDPVAELRPLAETDALGVGTSNKFCVALTLEDPLTLGATLDVVSGV